MQKVLVTGGAGYIGCILTEHLLAEGFAVTVLDNLRYHQSSLAALAAHPHFTFIFGDVRDEQLMKELVPQFEILLPLAAIVGAPVCERYPEDAMSINYEAIALLNRLRQPRQKVIFPTSNSGYGTKSSTVDCTEETPLEPISLYGKTKVDAERLLLDSGNAITLRLATVFGVSPRMRTDLLVNNFVQKALFEKKLVLFEKQFKRNFIHIRDVARCFAHGIRNYQQMNNNAYNVGLDQANLSKEELALAIKRFLPDTMIIDEEFSKDPDKRNYIVSNKKLYTTGFLPQYSIETGIKELITAYKIFGNGPLGNG